MKKIPSWLHTVVWVAAFLFIVFGAWRVLSKEMKDASQMWQPFVPGGVFTFFSILLSVVDGFGVRLGQANFSSWAVVLPFLAAGVCAVVGLMHSTKEYEDTRKTLFGWATNLGTFAGGVFLGGAVERKAKPTNRSKQ